MGLRFDGKKKAKKTLRDFAKPGDVVRGRSSGGIFMRREEFGRWTILHLGKLSPKDYQVGGSVCFMENIGGSYGLGDGLIPVDLVMYEEE